MALRLPAIDPAAYRVARPPAALAHRAGHAWEQAALPLIARRAGSPIVYSPANLAPLAWKRNVVSIHDAVALAHPEWYSRPYVAWQRALLPRLGRNALRVLTGSVFARDELVRVLGVDAASVEVVPGGVDRRFNPDAQPAHRPRPYVLSVATLGARKNLAALDALAESLGPDGIEVVVAGSRRAYLADEPAAGGVRHLGYVPDDDLPGLYAGASAFVLPSRHEGFGLTCIEAMACGTPVVATRAGALPETVGEAGVLVDDARDLTEAVQSVLRDPEPWRRRGLDRAAGLTWQRAAGAVDAVLRTCA